MFEFFRYLKKLILKNLLRFFWIFPVEENKITLLNELSYSYGDSLKYIDLYLHKQTKKQYCIVYPLRKGGISPNNSDIVVLPNTFKYFHEILTSKIVITNAGGVSFLPKRRNQKIINTWHGGGPYKKTSTDVYNNYWYCKEVMMNSDNTDYILSSCQIFTDYEAKSMGYTPNKCIPSGFQRNDIFFEQHDKINKKVRDYYNIPDNANFVLYAPTFRSDGDTSKSKMISNDIDIDVNMVLFNNIYVFDRIKI